MYNTVNKFVERVIETGAQDETFDFDTYKFAEELRSITEIYAVEFPKILAPMKTVKENIDKNIVFSEDYSPDKIHDMLLTINRRMQFNSRNPVLGKTLSDREITKMGSLLSSEWNKEANNTREGAFPFV